MKVQFTLKIRLIIKRLNQQGSVQFPLDQTLPVSLIKEIIKFGLKKNNKI